jgi:hypothetical protein
VELVVVMEAMVLAPVAPFTLGASLPSSPVFLGTSLDAPVASAPASPASYSPFVTSFASELQPLDQSQPVEDSEDPFLLVVV